MAKEENMERRFEIGDKVLICGTISRIEITPKREVLYYCKEGMTAGLPVPDSYITGKQTDYVPRARATISKANIRIQLIVSLVSGIIGAGVGLLLWRFVFSLG